MKPANDLKVEFFDDELVVAAWTPRNGRAAAKSALPS
jgi:hypothetical protein